MLLFSPFNFLFGNLRQAKAHPLRQRAIVKACGFVPQRLFVLIVSQQKTLVLCHEKDGSDAASILTQASGCIYSLNTRMAFAEGCQNNRITGKPDSAPCNNLPLLLGAFLLDGGKLMPRSKATLDDEFNFFMTQSLGPHWRLEDEVFKRLCRGAFNAGFSTGSIWCIEGRSQEAVAQVQQAAVKSEAWRSQIETGN